MGNWPNARLGEAQRNGEPVKALLRSIGVSAYVARKPRMIYEIGFTPPGQGRQAPPLDWYLRWMTERLEGFEVVDSHEQFIMRPQGQKRRISVSMTIAGQPRLKPMWMLPPPKRSTSEVDESGVDSDRGSQARESLSHQVLTFESTHDSHRAFHGVFAAMTCAQPLPPL